jgi:IS1 family transposase
MWSFVRSKGNVQWIWIALDAETREVVGVAMGSRDESGARALWKSLPEDYRRRAFCYTDFWKAYAKVIPSEQHEAVGKESGKTSLVERFNNTARQRISRLVRKTLSFLCLTNVGTEHLTSASRAPKYCFGARNRSSNPRTSPSWCSAHGKRRDFRSGVPPLSFLE